MNKITLLIIILFAGLSYAQITAPNSYTSNYRFRLWSQGANPSADSLNANWTLADTKIKLAYDSAQAKVSLTGTQALYNKTLASPFIQNPIILDNLYFFGTPSYAILNTNFSASLLKISFDGGANYDTLATLSDVRNGAGAYAPLAGASFTGDVSMAADIRQPRNSITVTTTSINVSDKTFCALTASSAQNLQTINGGSDGKIIYLENSGSYTITIEDAVNNIECAGNCILGQFDTITFIYNAAEAQWVELSRSNN